MKLSYSWTISYSLLFFLRIPFTFISLSSSLFLLSSCRKMCVCVCEFERMINLHALVRLSLSLPLILSLCRPIPLFSSRLFFYLFSSKCADVCVVKNGRKSFNFCNSLCIVPCGSPNEFGTALGRFPQWRIFVRAQVSHDPSQNMWNYSSTPVLSSIYTKYIDFFPLS